MDPEVKTQEQKKDKTKPLLIILVLLLVVCVAGMGIFILTRQPTTVDNTANNNAGQDSPVLKYADKGVASIDEESLQKAVDEMFKVTEDDQLGLYFKNDAFSDDGINFTCYIGNSTANFRDTYFTICTDAELTDIVFLSDLLRPGEVFESISLTHPLEQGDHLVYCAQTLVNEEQEITNQAVFTLNFHVR